MKCRKAVPREKPYKIHDGGGLRLLIKPNGSKLWLFRYSVGQKEKSFSIGPYPEISLAQAREARIVAAAKLRDGVDPSAERQRKKAEMAGDALGNFEAAARRWQAERAKTLTPRYAEQMLSRLEQNVFPKLGKHQLRTITPAMVRDMVQKVEERAAHEMAHRVFNYVSDIFNWAMANGLADQNPATPIRKALVQTDPKLRPAKVNLAQARQVLIKTEAMAGVFWTTLLGSRLLALTAARPGVVRLAEKEEFEGLSGPEPLWRIPAAKMKLTRARKQDITWEFVIPLSKQAAAVAKAAIGESLACQSADGPHWLFPSISKWTQPFSDSTLSKLYRDAGFKDQHVPHGWRSTFSTIMNERAAVDDRERDRAIIDLMLAHAQAGVEPIYNRAAYMPRRRELAQQWADMLVDGMPSPETLLPDMRKRRIR